VLRIGLPGHAKQDIRIYQTRINCHLVPVLVNPFSRNGLGKRRDFVGRLREGSSQARICFGVRTCLIVECGFARCARSSST
jgi:hypothetical protein